ncbi:tRNA(Ile)-lysidine synthetase [Altererythrobacter sp. B11]|uniref:tRNA lysidine(34) synthetase TilS n=1 Tax=Altererythrobacter sp. B11 TaxID=2060312 RepID=UPI000DC7039A|nr:tRNA lysidine(34) synthetase TilS [Altererythrobacter sp. B11]BBC72113.1 tRNA(Ile)-lysidine synthetase [Altererythrobacter sp. B11]
MSATADGSTAAEASPGGATARFADALAQLWPGEGRIGLAVSGGVDSLALLLLAEAAIPGRFEVATVDHGLRAEAAGECAMVARLCAGRGIACAVLPVSVASGNLQASARAARYAALSAWARERGLGALATAHHADDQVETVLMRLARGSGVAGLAGIRARGVVPGSDLPLLRPLLGFDRAELESIVAAAGLDPVRDPSNLDERYDRVRLRRWLAENPLIGAEAVRASAAHCADADAALVWAAEREWAERVERVEGGLRYRPAAPRAVALRMLERAVAELGGSARGGALAAMLSALERGESANAGGVLARAERGVWLFTAEPPRRGT